MSSSSSYSPNRHEQQLSGQQQQQLSDQQQHLSGQQQQQQSQLDVVAYMSAVRAAGFCRPLPHTISLLEAAFNRHGGEGVLSVAYTAITNLKYVDRSMRLHGVEQQQQQERSVLSRANELFEWILAKGISPSVQTMVRCGIATDQTISMLYYTMLLIKPV